MDITLPMVFSGVLALGIQTETVLLVFTGILALAVVIQAFLFYGIYRGIREMGSCLDAMGKDLLRNIGVISDKVDEGLSIIRDTAEGLKSIQGKLSGTADIIHNRVADIDLFFAETVDRARQQVLHIQDSIQAATQKANDAIDLLHGSLLVPLTEISAISRAIRVAMDVLFRRRRNPGSAQDEEMFI